MRESSGLFLRNEEEVTVDIGRGDIRLKGNLSIPARAKGIVLFAHGSGRFSPRNRFVAKELNKH